MSEEIQKASETQEKAVAKLDQFNNTQEIYAFAKVLCESKLVPASFNTPEKVVLAIAQGKELGLPAVTSIYNMYFISGKPSLGIHAILALLTKNKIAYETLEDYIPIDDEGNVVTKAEATDVRTTILFYRKNEYLDVVIKEKISFTWSDAIKAGLHEKDNWTKYRKIMMWNRCAVFGARRIAPDVLLGVMETSEAGDTFGKKYNIDDQGEAQIVE